MQPATIGEPSAEASQRTLWMGDLAPWMDEAFLYSCFVATGQLASVKVIRNRDTRLPEGFGFVEFTSREAAEYVLKAYNGQAIPNTEQVFRLNWSAFGVGKGTEQGAWGGWPAIFFFLSMLCAARDLRLQPACQRVLAGQTKISAFVGNRWRALPIAAALGVPCSRGCSLLRHDPGHSVREPARLQAASKMVPRALHCTPICRAVQAPFPLNAPALSCAIAYA